GLRLGHHREDGERPARRPRQRRPHGRARPTRTSRCVGATGSSGERLRSLRRCRERVTRRHDVAAVGGEVADKDLAADDRGDRPLAGVLREPLRAARARRRRLADRPEVAMRVTPEVTATALALRAGDRVLALALGLPTRADLAGQVCLGDRARAYPPYTLGQS